MRTPIKRKWYLFLFAMIFACTPDKYSITLFEDDMQNMPSVSLSSYIGAHSEYHYVREAAPVNGWEVSTFRWDASQTAWKVYQENGRKVIKNTFINNEYDHSHPTLVTGNPNWKNYKLEVHFTPESDNDQCGIMFRYRNDRCYYFFGVDKQNVVLKMAKHGTAFRVNYEEVLDSAEFNWEPGSELKAVVIVKENNISCSLNNAVELNSEDDTYSNGRIGFLTDVRTSYNYVKVSTTNKDKQILDEVITQQEHELKEIKKDIPKMAFWKKINTQNFGVGRNLRFGDLNNDGNVDVLIGQVLQHGPKDRFAELSCLTAMTFDGEILWQIGEPDMWKNNLTNDVGFQVHDINNDGKTEIVYCMKQKMIVADASTGKTLYEAKTPIAPDGSKQSIGITFDRILGDCIFLCDVSGKGRDSDILIKDRYRYFWLYDEHLNPLWSGECVTGHYPYAYDTDNDGKDEIAIGYSLYDDNGKQLWSLDNQLNDHCDGVAVVKYKEDEEPIIMNAASDEGIYFADLSGNILKHHYLGHVQNPAVANFRDDLPGLETLTINFWGNQGIVHFFNSDGEIYHDFEPNQYGSMCLPLNWTGKSEEFFVHNPNVEEGGVFDGWGRKVLEFPDDGHPDMCNAVLDITGDCRDEIVVWDPYDIWVYTQEDNPKEGKLYKPVRNPLYNYSNYQASVSMPGWSE